MVTAFFKFYVLSVLNVESNKSSLNLSAMVLFFLSLIVGE